MKKIILFITLLFITSCEKYGRSTGPDIACEWLPWCNGEKKDPQDIIDYISNFIALLIQYVWVVAVIAVMISGIMYILSAGEEEKVKKAKTWVIWSLVWVFMSVFAWWIIQALNNITLLW